ncbi:MAG: Carboxypeptidase regulatory-like domain [Thermoplasmata archaeon]|jgi:hypothetical protein|nr:Carboxypeptidase regulatory-like domain [Thermoplasmata archaeon]MEA3165551.1 Carboxypeptidase regulatory-like domain [Thermoplasmata archaeon]
MRGVAVAVLLLSALLAGCNGAPSAPAEVVIESKPAEEIHSEDPADPVEAVFTPSPKTRGHIAGVVVDDAIRPIEGAVVHLPGLDLERVTDRDGSFGFVDLHPGPYFITINATGFYDAEAVLQVSADEFTRAKVILTRIPPPDPYRVQQSFEGFADVTADPVFGISFFCSACNFDFYLDRQGLDTVIVEAYLKDSAEGSGFNYDFYPESGYGVSGTTGNPMRLEQRNEDLGDGDHFNLRLDPRSFPVPEQSKRFQVYVTAFYNAGPPTGWSFVAGDP